jgi:hypothetical protein
MFATPTEQFYKGYILVQAGACIIIGEQRDRQYIRSVPGGFEDAIEVIDGWTDKWEAAE